MKRGSTMKVPSYLAVIAIFATGCAERQDSQLSDASSSSGVVFDRGACPVSDPPDWRACEAREREFSFGAPSETPLPLVRAASFKGRIRYRFACNSSEPLTAWLKVGESPRMAIASSGDVVVTPELVVSYKSSTFKLGVERPHPATFVDADCRLEVLGAELLPPVDLLEAYADQVVERRAEVDEVVASLREAEGRPETYAAVMAAPVTLLSHANRLMSISCRRDLRALSRLLAKDPLDRTDDDRADIWALGGFGLDEPEADDGSLRADQVCPLFASDALAAPPPSYCANGGTAAAESLPLAGALGHHVESARQLLCTALDVQRGLPPSAACEGGDGALCDARVASIAARLESHRKTRSDEAASLMRFLLDEIARLAGSSTSIRSDLEATYQMLSEP
jgi:hypothetical protein